MSLRVTASVVGFRIRKKSSGGKQEPKIIVVSVDRRQPSIDQPWTEEQKAIFGDNPPNATVGNNFVIAESPIFKGIKGSPDEKPGDGSRIHLIGDGWKFYDGHPGGALAFTLAVMEDDADKRRIAALVEGVMDIPVVKQLIEAGTMLAPLTIQPVIGEVRAFLPMILGVKDDDWLRVEYSGSELGRYATEAYPLTRGVHYPGADGLTMVSFHEENNKAEVDVLIKCWDDGVAESVVPVTEVVPAVVEDE